MTLAPNGRRIASVAYDNTERVWEVESGRLLSTLGGHKGLVREVAFSPDGRRIVSDNDTVILDDAGTGAEIAWLPHNIPNLATHASGRIWAAVLDTKVVLFQLEGTSFQ